MLIQKLSSPVAAVSLSVLPPLSLYVHIPWCVRKCPYCDFNSHELKPPLPGPLPPGEREKNLDRKLEEQYVRTLVLDLDAALPQIWGRPVRTIFFGGGTPSLLSAAAIDGLLSAIRARLPLVADAEITLEANPGTFEAEKFAAFRAAGINRLSVGIQSFDPVHLKVLGRIHDDAQARGALEIARNTFDNFNLDLMYGLPGQTIDQALADIEAGLEFSPTHLSAYHLTIEPNTLFHRHPPRLPDDEASADMQEAIEQRMARAGYLHYETSAFALPERQARHNLNYWAFGDYLGIGAGAHGKISFPDRITRHSRIKQPKDYLLAEDTLAEDRVVPAGEVPFEFALNALRLTEGFEVKLFSERTGLPLSEIEGPLSKAEKQGLLERDWRRIRPSARGRLFLNELLELFLAGESRDRG